MLTFEIKLSFQACQLLFSCIEYNRQVELKLAEIEKEEASKKFSGLGIRHNLWVECVHKTNKQKMFVTQARQLTVNGLLHMKSTGARSNRLDGWKVTEKGYLMAQVLKIEFEEAKKAAKQLSKVALELST